MKMIGRLVVKRRLVYCIVLMIGALSACMNSTKTRVKTFDSAARMVIYDSLKIKSTVKSVDTVTRAATSLFDSIRMKAGLSNVQIQKHTTIDSTYFTGDY